MPGQSFKQANYFEILRMLNVVARHNSIKNWSLFISNLNIIWDSVFNLTVFCVPVPHILEVMVPYEERILGAE